VSKPLRVAIPDLISNSYFPAIAAVELGLVEGQIELCFPVTTAMEGLRDGRFDFVAGAAHAVLHAFPDWRGAKLLAAVAQRMYWFLVLRSDLVADAVEREMLVLGSDTAHRRNDVQLVRGLRIGAAPGPDLGLRHLLAESGIDPDRDVHIAPVPGVVRDSVSFGVTAAHALAEGALDGFWANGMGAEVAVRRGTGTVVLDVRRGDGPPGAASYTFPALVGTERTIAERPDDVQAMVAGLVQAQAALRADPSVATDIGRRLFPAMEAELIAELIQRDAPYYDASISPETVDGLNRFSVATGLICGPAPYERVVAAELSQLWQ
jgi:NitT/TauT family transport system substrate-binding protein